MKAQLSVEIGKSKFSVSNKKLSTLASQIENFGTLSYKVDQI